MNSRKPVYTNRKNARVQLSGRLFLHVRAPRLASGAMRNKSGSFFTTPSVNLDVARLRTDPPADGMMSEDDERGKKHRVVGLGASLAGCGVGLGLKQAGYQRRPAGLMTGPQAFATVAVKVLVEQYQVLPIALLGEPRIGPVAGPSAVAVWQKEIDEPPLNLICDFGQRTKLARASWALNLERGSVELIVGPQRFDEQVVDRKPNRSPPIAIATEHR